MDFVEFCVQHNTTKEEMRRLVCFLAAFRAAKTVEALLPCE